MGPVLTASDPLSLETKYRLEAGRIFLSGVQALVRVPLDQHRADRRRGLDTATLISGYRGSPLGGLDQTVERHHDLLTEHQVVFISGVNEDLGATAVLGSQLAHLYGGARYDGVLGMWYGKAPGVDRSGDILRHANFAGIGRHGGVLALAGDDPQAKSSTLPTHSEVAFYDFQMPVLFPGSIQDILDLGRLGFELSRYSGLWVAFKVVTDVADAVGTAEVHPDRVQIADPGFVYEGRPWEVRQLSGLLPPYTLDAEREIAYGRLEAARAFAAANAINRITVETPDAWLGIAAAGKAYYDLRQALTDLGLDDAALRRHGIRLLKLGMLFPLERGIVREFARGLEELLVVEEKRGFLELLLREALYDLAVRPRIVGKRDEAGEVLVPADGELDADLIARVVARRLQRRVALDSVGARVAVIEAARERPVSLTLARPPFFCSGCPHNRSTVVPEGSVAAAGIGCHGLAMNMGRNVIGITQMGGEGAQWVGLAPFVDMPHLFQQLGDGTLFHSGSLAIRQAVSAGTNVTFKILYNSAVAMTGGQDAAGAVPVPELTRQLDAEGVRRILVLTDEPEKYPRGARWAPGVEVWHRDRLDEAQRSLRDVPGVTALIYDQRCAAEKRRLRKRGKLPDPALRVVINELVCEGCGDCGVKSNCLSVQPVETEFGRKTQIHQSSCNKDYSCLRGDCPSFLTVLPAAGPRPPRPRKRYTVDQTLPEPELRVRRTASLFLMGIGGTGVVTVNQILGTAALLDGKHVAGLDQTGLSQKGGPVVSHLRIGDAAADIAGKVGVAEADLYLGLDLLVATAAPNLLRARPDLTIAVVSTAQVPTGAMVASTDVSFPDPGGLLAAVNRVTRKDENVFVDAAGLGEALFGDHMAANMILLGAAYQAGAIPVRAAAIEEAIAINGVQLEMNTQAFRVGRLLVVDPGWAKTVERRRAGAVTARAELGPVARALVDSVGAGGELRRLLEVRVPELIAYQDAAYVRPYVEFVRRVAEAERAAVPGETRLAETVARHLYKLMAYKDEYEVARLHLRPEVRESIRAELGEVRLRYQLHPPFLRALGMRRKVSLGTWIEGVFRLLVALRRLRGTALDPFGYAEVRRVERALVAEYRTMVEGALRDLTPERYECAVRIARLPDLIRGYEDVKIRNVRRFRDEARALGARS